jgi:hypothetical protein
MAATHPSTYQLGNPTTTHRAGLSVWITLVSGTIFALLGSYAMIALFASGARAVKGNSLALPALGLGVGITFLVIGYIQSRQRIQLFEHGFTYIKAGTTRVIRWDEIESVQQQIVRQHVYFIPVATLYTYTIRTLRGETLKLTNSVGKVAQLGALIQGETFKRLMPRALEIYNGGGTLQYGKLSISQAGIGNGKEIVPWSQVKGVRVSNGFIVVQKDGKWLAWTNVAVSRTPNFYIFLALVNQIMGVKG